MTLLLREEDVRALLDMPSAIAAVRDALVHSPDLSGNNLPRRRLALDAGALQVMAASTADTQSTGLKAYTAGAHGALFLVALWDRLTGCLLALIEADWLGRMRTGAASAVATDCLARTNATVLALLGTGGQAETQLTAIAAVRSLSEVRVWSRSPQHRKDFARRMSSEVGCPVHPVQTPDAAIEGAHMVTTISSASHPILHGDLLPAGCHVNLAGSNWPDRREADSVALARANIVTVDSIEQAKIEAGDLIVPVEDGLLSWDAVYELGEVLTGGVEGRTSEKQVTLFKSLGIALEDVAVARLVYDRARECGRGEESSFGVRRHG